MTLLFTSVPASIGKCGHGLPIAQLGDQTLHVIATNHGRLILARCDDEPIPARSAS